MGTFIGYYILLLITIFIHELGHVFGALISSYKIIRFKVGPIEYTKTGSSYKIGLSRGMFTGMVNVARPEGPLHISKELIFVSSGVAANYTFALCLVVSYYVWPQYEYKGFLMIGAIASGVMATINMIPWSNKRTGVVTDGVYIIVFFINWLAGLKKPNKSVNSQH